MIEIFKFDKIICFSHPNDIFLKPLLNSLKEISATWQPPPVAQLRMIWGIHSTDINKQIVLIRWHLHREM